METNPRGIGTLTVTVKFMLYAGLGLAFIAAGIAVADLNRGTATLSADNQLYFDGVDALMLLATYAVFGRWLWVASRNLWDRDVEGLAYFPASCIWWYAIPIANLFKPYGAMREIWNGSMGASGAGLEVSNNSLRIWWGFWLLSGFLSYGTVLNDVPPPNLVLALSLSNIGLYWIASRVVSTIGTAQARGLINLQGTFA